MQAFTADNGKSEIEIKRSRFIGVIKKAESEDAARKILNDIKKEHAQARHNCYAYIVNESGQERVKYSDDGEPQGTAGLPILKVLTAKKLSGVVCVVTRYFGGIKLGAGGLTRAYTETAAAAVNAATVTELIECACFSINFPYENYKKFSSFKLPEKCVIENLEYCESVNLQLVLSADLADKFIADFENFFLKKQPISRLSNVLREFSV